MERFILLVCAGLWLAGCSSPAPKPQGPSYQQQQESSDKAFKELGN